LRQAVLHRTTLLLRRGRRLKRFGLATGMAACYLAGILTMGLVLPVVSDTPSDRRDGGSLRIDQRPERQRRGDEPAPSGKSPADQIREKERKPPTPVEDAPSAVALEWQAIDNPSRRAELYRRAGDLYLAGSSDVRSALRCYRGALAAGSPRDWVISTNDNWLLMVAKQERQKEMSHAKNGG
jgi:hypothetical protein